MGVQVGWPKSHPFAPYSISSSQKLGSTVCLYPFTRLKINDGAVARRLTLSKGCAIIRACCAKLDQFSDDGFFPRLDDHDDYCDDDHKNSVSKIFENSRYNEDDDDSSNMGFSASFSSSKLDSLRPSWLEIWPEPPNWPGRDEIIQASIERKAVRFDIPVSLRMIKRKQQWEEGVTKGEDSVYCSVKKAFSSMVFIIRELQSYSLQIKEILYCEDLQGILSRVHRELHASFVWLFQQVFSKTPTLMVYLMILLANFTVYSLMDDTENAETSIPPTSSMITETFSVTERENQPQPNFQSLIFLKTSSVTSPNEVVKTSISTRPLPMTLCSNVVADEYGSGELTHMEEVNLWNSVVEEASRMAAESGAEALDHETIQRMVSPVGVELEADDYIEYFRTDLLYQIRISEDPNNPLLLCNYGQFLRLFARDQDRAEECFKRAVEVEPEDGEALNQYANFLWMVRKDLWGAEERFLQAMAAEPGNPYRVSNYATFLWNTGGGDTCFPLQPSQL
ncbi:uncharacterized protein LOC117927987 [Vitis riparia]|uniref:uncharacterized protein LOC117927987 n=1 Tax=Vitis riparia TaxID=96939 RepID=UPI00155B09BA|nr:uncharacterized protein LOC117927987 [Vitis riparia]